MTSFPVEWLALREPYDLRARNADVLAAVAAHVAGRHSIGIVDLACGTGSTFRAVAAHLTPRQDWRLVDNDLGLLGRAAMLARRDRHSIRAAPVDLALDLEAALDGPIDLVTTSALLDLVSDEWLERLVVEAAVRRLPVYAALIYDGRVTLDPADPLDRKIIASVNRHQLRDKGFGPALGPTAAAATIERFRRAGYAVVQGPSDWRLAPQDLEIQQALIAGWAVAAHEHGDLPSADIAAWLERRHDRAGAGRSTMRVGHIDVFARPTTTR
jgi:hypothetical protein